MRNTSVDLHVFYPTNEDGSRRGSEHPILRAARQGDADELKELLKEKCINYNSAQTYHRYVYPEDWKYHYKDLLETRDHEGRTALHLAAGVGNHDMALASVTAILESIQLLMNDSEGTSLEKHSGLVNAKDKYRETALHLAIENRAPKVVAYLVENQANIIAKDSNGNEALLLIYKTLPDAMNEVYDNSVQMTEDYKRLSIDWGPIIGFRHKTKPNKTGRNYHYNQVPADNVSTLDEEWWNESEYLKYVLNSNKWGPPVLLHPLIKLYLEIKWRKVQWFFWLSLAFQMLWLGLYFVAFVVLHINLKSSRTGNGTDRHKREAAYEGESYHIIWILLVPLTLICALKEIYQFSVLRRKAYISFENVIQDTFILLLLLQWILLAAGLTEVIRSVSVIGAVLCTVLMVTQLGKSPSFGRQVAALKKVIYSCAPQLPVFFVWFIGFGLIFWAIFFDADTSWVVAMVGIMAAMGTGELNAKDHFEDDVKEGEATGFREVVRVSSVFFFVMVIVVLYYNLLQGYAVSDIQILQVKAEELELSNRLNTIYTVEEFLISKLGKYIVSLKCKVGRLLCHSTPATANTLDTIYVCPPHEFREQQGVQELMFETMSTELLMKLRKIAYANIKREKEKGKNIRKKLLELTQPDESELRLITAGLRY